MNLFFYYKTHLFFTNLNAYVPEEKDTSTEVSDFLVMETLSRERSSLSEAASNQGVTSSSST